MRILVTGAAGMIGRKLCARLAADGAIAGRPIETGHLVDVVARAPPAGARFATLCESLDLAAPSTAARRLDLFSVSLPRLHPNRDFALEFV